jgi:ketosteroid isomerase-like protein
VIRTNLQIIQEHYAASDRGDLAGMLADLAPDAAWTEMAGFPYAGTYVGPQAVADGVFKRIAGEWDGYTFKLERLFDAGGAIIATGHYTGTYKRTGKSFRCRVCHLWQLSDGRIRKFEQFCDTLLVAEAMRTGRAE